MPEEWADAARRSLITLKALTFGPTGGIVAAPTTSLPEQIGGPRNWDYRYCWLRDATFTLHALLDAGYVHEADAWNRWLRRAVAGSPDKLQIMYGVTGDRRLTESVLDWLPGYEGSAPVRIGNAASEQFQLDVYGETLDMLLTASTALPERRGPGERDSGRPRTRRPTSGSGTSAASSSSTCARCGPSPTRASGRCAARAATSCTRR